MIIMRAINAILASLLLLSCRKEWIPRTISTMPNIPWTDSSYKHPLNAELTALINKYTAKGLPGIALLVTDKNGTWVGSAGKADIEHNKPFTINQVSKIASIHKLFLATLLFKLFEDSVHSGLGYN